MLKTHTNVLAKNVIINVGPCMVTITAFGMLYGEVRYDTCGLPQAIRIVADVLEVNAEAITKTAKAWAER